MSELRFTSNSAEFKAMTNKLGQELYKTAREGFVDIQETWVRNMKKDRFTGYYPGPTRGNRLRARSGHLRSSTGGRVTGKKLGTLRALLRIGGGRAGYARLQEEGGTITPTGGRRFLTVPLRQALRPGTGTLKPSAVIRRDADGYATSMGPTFIMNVGGRPLIMVKKGKRGTIVPLYTLRSSVKIPARLGAGDELQDVGKAKLPQMSEELLRVLVETKGAV